MKRAHLSAAVFFAFLLALTLNAGLISNVTLLDFSSQFASGNDQRRATNVINGSGLFGDAHTYYPPGNMWLTTTAAGSNPGTNFITFDLGVVRTLGVMRVWNYNEIVSGVNVLVRRGVARADVSTAGEDLSFTTNFADAVFNAAPGRFTNNFAQSFDFGGIAARYVRINIRTNHGELGADVSVGLSKVLFYDTNIQPAVISAIRNWSNNRIAVRYAESVSAASAAAATNYSILLSGTNAATIQSAAMDTYNNVVMLQTSTLDSNLVYTLEVRNVRSAADNSAITTNQIALTAELALWLKANAGVNPDLNGFVSQWNDQSGNGNHALQPNAAAQPTLVPNVLNGMPAMHFDGITNYFEVAHAPSLVIRHDYSVFAVVMVDDLVNFNAILGKTAGNQPAPLDMYILNGTGAIRSYRATPAGNGGGNGLLTSSQNVVAGVPVVIGCVMRGTNTAMYFNGPIKGATALVAGVLDVGKPLRIGTRDDFVTKMKGSIAELMMFRGAVSDIERANITEYLGAKYGIMVTNLAITLQPTNVTQLEGQTATFAAAAAAAAAVSYQWQRYGTNLPSATNASYTTPVLTQADNNSTFRVQVSIPGTAQFSDTAILAVLPDTESPTVVSAGRIIWSPSEVVVTFSEAMSSSTATNAGDYSLDNGGAVSSAAVGDTANKVVLSTTGLTNGGTYMLTVQNVKDLFNNTIVTTQVPLTVYPAAGLWLSAGVGATVDVDGYITQWNDLSGNGNNATPSFGVPFAPQIITNGFNGQPVARFAGAGEPMFTPASPSLAMGDMSIYAVVSLVDYGNYNAFVGRTAGNLPASYDFYTVVNSGEPRFYRGNGGGGALAQVTGTAAPSLGVPHVISVVMGGTSVAHFLDGQPNGTGTLNTTLEDTGPNVGIGTRNDGFTKLKGDLAEIFIFGSALSAADRVALDNHFGAKYGIQVGTLPRLSIGGGPTGLVVLTWPTPAVPFDLESATNIVAGPWSPVTNNVTGSGGTNSVSINVTESGQFFRLHKQ